MVTIYYPYFDLESRGLIPSVNDHVLNIKLLLLIADRVLILTSHLLDTDIKRLSDIIDELHDFAIEGNIVFPLYEGQMRIEDYLEQKIGKAEGTVRYEKYVIHAELLRTQLFDGRQKIINVNNEDERKQFQMIYSEMNLDKAKELGEKKLIKSSTIFFEELLSQKEKVGTYLTLFEVNELIERLVKNGKISRRHKEFFIRNQISSYYYCGSVAHSAIVAYNPFFEDIRFDQTTKDIEFHTTNVYSPGFLLDVLMGLKVIDKAEDISLLSKDSMNLIRKDKAWIDFQMIFDDLNKSAQSLDLILYKEHNVDRKIEKIKNFTFCFVAGATSTLISVIIDQLLAGFVMLAVSTIVNFFFNVISGGETIRRLRKVTTDEIINRLYSTKEPFYVIAERIKQAVEKTVTE